MNKINENAQASKKSALEALKTEWPRKWEQQVEGLMRGWCIDATRELRTAVRGGNALYALRRIDDLRAEAAEYGLGEALEADLGYLRRAILMPAVRPLAGRR